MSQPISFQAEQYLSALQLQYDERSNISHGTFGGYQIFLSHSTNGNPMQLHFFLTQAGKPPELSLLSQCRKRCKKHMGQVSITRNHCVCLLKGGNLKKRFENLKEALPIFTDALRENGIENCCQCCGTPVHIEEERHLDPYILSGSPALLCSTCYQTICHNVQMKQIADAETRENVVAGTVGALLGSLLGAASIILLDAAGYVAAISGVILAVCSLKGYELLGKKLSKKGVFISILFMVLMVWAGNRMSWTISIRDAYNQQYPNEAISLMECFQYLKQIITSEAYTSYLGNLVMVAIFAILGAFPTVKNSMAASTGKTKETYPLTQYSQDSINTVTESQDPIDTEF